MSHGFGPKSRSLGARRIPGSALPRPHLSPFLLLPWRGFPSYSVSPGRKKAMHERFGTPSNCPHVALDIRSARSHSRKGRHQPLFVGEEEEAASP